MDALVVCDGCSSHAQARVGAASSSSCPPAASLPVPHCRLPVITEVGGMVKPLSKSCRSL
ncbi:hypothetical protein VPH35_022390 [Triticum aestivum]